MINLQLDMIQTTGLAIVMLLLGRKVRNKFNILSKYCIPSPVVGGLIFAIIAFLLFQFNILNFEFNKTLQHFFMTMFFTSVGFNASIKVLKKGGIQVFVFLLVAVGLIFCQNIVAIILAKPLGINPLLALMTGSTSMTGGHGTSAAISVAVGLPKASTVAISSATFGLIAGSIVGGPIANRLIKKNKLMENHEVEIEHHEEADELFFKNTKSLLNGDKVTRAFFLILLSMAFGTILNKGFKLIGLDKIPYYLGPMITAAIIRNLTDYIDRLVASPLEEIKIIENISLNIFLSMALMSLRLADLIDLALPITVLLIAQVIVVVIYTRFVTYNVMGRNYDAAVMVAGHCGFGMGATPNGITNMETVCEKYADSKLAFFVIPIVGALFIDFVNVAIISGFLSFLM